MPINSNRGFEKSLKNYRTKYMNHLNYWTNLRKTNYWITFENPLSNYLDMINECQFNSNSNICQDISSPTDSTDSGIQLNMERDDRTSNNVWENSAEEQNVFYRKKYFGTENFGRFDSLTNSPSFSSSSSSETNSSLYKSDSENSIRTFDDSKNENRFVVRFLGSTNIDEEDLLNGKSSRTVNRCIFDLTLDVDDSILNLNEREKIYLEIDRTEIVFLDSRSMKILKKQSIPSIRVWAVGRENSRDFAFVAKEKRRNESIFKCHVFRCEHFSGRTIGQLLKEICRSLMSERGLFNPTPVDSWLNRFSGQIQSTNEPNFLSFPKPNDATKKIFFCRYLSAIRVEKSSGVDVLRSAIEKLSSTIPKQRWTEVVLEISTSSINVSTNDSQQKNLFEFRLRYLSFLGVGQDVNFCAFIVHCVDGSFKCHVFHCQPSSIELCQNLEAACKLRFQKCLDAHPATPKTVVPSKNYSAQLKTLVESFWWGNK